MKRSHALVLAALALACLAGPVAAQYPYPYPPPVYGQPIMPVGAAQPMVVPVPVPLRIAQPVPMFGALETMPAGGPLDSAALEGLLAPQAGVVAAPVGATPPAPTTVQTAAKTPAAPGPQATPAPVKSVSAPVSSPATEPAKPSLWQRVRHFVNIW